MHYVACILIQSLTPRKCVTRVKRVCFSKWKVNACVFVKLWWMFYMLKRILYLFEQLTRALQRRCRSRWRWIRPAFRSPTTRLEECLGQYVNWKKEYGGSNCLRTFGSHTSAVSTPIFAIKYSVFADFGHLPYLHTCAPPRPQRLRNRSAFHNERVFFSMYFPFATD